MSGDRPETEHLKEEFGSAGIRTGSDGSHVVVTGARDARYAGEKQPTVPNLNERYRQMWEEKRAKGEEIPDRIKKLYGWE